MKLHSTTSREAFWNDPLVYCDFCKELRGFPSAFSRLHPEFAGSGSRVALNAKYFFLVPSLGQIISDHALLISHEHVTSSAQCSDEAITELDQMLTKLQAKWAGEHKQQLVFEHGVPSDGAAYGGCGICHCHVHCLPLALPEYNPVEALTKFLRDKQCKFASEKIESWREIRKWEKAAYICVRAGKDNPVIFVFDAGQRLESQLMRQFIAQDRQDANKAWDWRSAGPEERAQLQESCKRLRATYGEAAVV
jgi:hypothetical protein